MPEWEDAHTAWRTAGNECGECERLERSVDSPRPGSLWTRIRILASSDSGLGFQPPVLRDAALVQAGEPGLREPDAPEPDERPACAERIAQSAPLTLLQLRREADNLELKIAGLHARGPTQSRVAWERSIASAEEELRRTWTAWADKVQEESVQRG